MDGIILIGGLGIENLERSRLEGNLASNREGRRRILELLRRIGPFY
jgi:hypothetical protein